MDPNYKLEYELHGVNEFLKRTPRTKITSVLPPDITVTDIQKELSSVRTESDFWNSDIFKVQKDLLDKKLFDLQDEGKRVSAGACSYCKSTNTGITEKKQRRSADEGMSYTFQCFSCGKSKIT